MGLPENFAVNVIQQQNKQKIPLALDRAVSQGGEASSQGPSNVHSEHRKLQDERNKHRELVREIRAIYEDKYGSITSDHRQDVDSAKLNNAASAEAQPITELPEPTIYKILAYDPTMQSISTADTTSIVADSASPLTPAEVLLRLSNPTKFFPHFEPLQAQGYEIVSGSGDVLVFRKVRPAGAGPTGTKSEEVSEYHVWDISIKANQLKLTL
jgi:hypothetical protein